MRTLTQFPRSEQRNTLAAMIAGIATIIVVLALALSLTPSPASAETPAERCKRETSAYNAAWAAIGKKPPAPYKCGGSNQAPPTLSPTTPEETPDETVAPTKSAPEGSDDDGPSLNAPTERRDLEHPGVDEPTIQEPGRQSSRMPQSSSAPRRPEVAPYSSQRRTGVQPTPPRQAPLDRVLRPTPALGGTMDFWENKLAIYYACAIHVARANGEELEMESAAAKYGYVCQRAGEGATNAENVAEDIYHDPPEHLDGKEDAMRHCTWNAFMAQDDNVGPKNARVVAAVYEAMGQNHPDTARMDKFNNEFGVRLFETGRANTARDAVVNCRAAVDNGDLVVLNP